MRLHLTAIVIAALILSGAATAATPVKVTTDQQWRQHPGIVMAASQPWEGLSTQEPTVLFVKGLYRMWYMGGNDGHCSLGYAVSKDGIRWARSSKPIMGAGELFACHNSVTYTGGRFYLYYSTLSSHGGLTDPQIWVAVSRDGVHFGKARIVLEPTAESYGMANTAVWNDGARWLMLYDSVPEAGGLWKMHLAASSSPLGPFRQLGGPLEGLSVGGVTGAPSIRKVDGVYQLWYLASTATDWVLPTDVYYAESTDLTHWTTPRLVVKREQPWQVDQIADPSVVTVNGVTRMWFSGLDNVSASPNVVGGVGMATLVG